MTRADRGLLLALVAICLGALSYLGVRRGDPFMVFEVLAIALAMAAIPSAAILAFMLAEARHPAMQAIAVRTSARFEWRATIAENVAYQLVAAESRQDRGRSLVRASLGDLEIDLGSGVRRLRGDDVMFVSSPSPDENRRRNLIATMGELGVRVEPTESDAMTVCTRL